MLWSEKLAGPLVAVGRIGLASMFLLGGLSKIQYYDAVQTQMSDVGLPFTGILLPIVILLELGGGLALAIGRLWAPLAALALALFTLSTNLFFHDFWNMTGAQFELESSQFFKNVSIAGALILYAGWTFRNDNQ